MPNVYDTPDGKDCLPKTADLAVKGGKVGAIISGVDMVLLSKPTTAMGIGRTFVYWTGPGIALGGTFAAVSCLMGELTGKDTPVNHIVGGAVSTMAVVGARYGVKSACLAAIPVTALAAIFKVVKISGYNLTPDPAKQRKEFGSFNHFARHYGPRTEVHDRTNY